MIDKREILDAATGLGLTPHVVEKDYVLGWLLWGVANHQVIADTWNFKGGTCLKKCFFETYRFSEDLDFTLADDAHLHEEFLRRVFADIAGAIYDRTGIEIPTDAQRFDLHRNPRGNSPARLVSRTVAPSLRAARTSHASSSTSQLTNSSSSLALACACSILTATNRPKA